MPKYTNVDDYMAAQSADGRRLLATIRGIVAEEVPGVTESIRYDMPVFAVDSGYLVHAAAWKRHIGLYPVPVFADDLEREVSPLRAAKDTVRFMYRDPFPDELFRRIVRELVGRHRG